MWKDKRVLVTGAAGFIGSHLVERLVQEGAQVRAMLRYTSNASRGWLAESPVSDDVDYVFGDIADPDVVDAAVVGTDAVFHLAALIGIPYSYAAPASYVATNITGTLNVLRASRAHGVGRVVHTSTSEVYGSAQYVPIDEKHPLVGQSPYSASKIGADQLAISYQRSFGLPIVIVRPFNTYGPRQSRRAVIPTVISQCLAGHAIRLGNLTATRDFNFVGDTVAGFLALAASDGAIGRVVNLGSGREISVGDMAKLVAHIVGCDAEIQHEAERDRPPTSEVERLVADATLAHTLSSWAPAVSLEEGLARTVDWFCGRDLRNVHEYVV